MIKMLSVPTTLCLQQNLKSIKKLLSPSPELAQIPLIRAIFIKGIKISMIGFYLFFIFGVRHIGPKTSE